jgi:acyl-coenzyme A synthetase/AMP-(fatty) acid ligase
LGSAVLYFTLTLHFLFQPGSMGLPVPGFPVLLVDDDGKEVPPMEEVRKRHSITRLA